MFTKKAETATPIHELIARRWSGRAFDPDRMIGDTRILALIEAARWAPSCYGDQPWRYIICNKANNPVAWKTACSCLAPGNRSWADKAPLLIIAVADTVLSQNGRPNRWGEYDTGAASENLSLQATAMNLIVHQMGGFDADKTRSAFAIPEQYTPMAVIAIGYQLTEEQIPDELKDREYADRNRNPAGENFFDGQWDQAIDIKP